MTEETKWKKLPAMEGKHGGCLNCGPRPSQFPPDGIIGVGFGFAALLCDGQVVHQEGDSPNGELMTGAQAEKIALKNPDHDWQIILDGPLSGRTYQRHGPDEWMLVDQNMGFA